LFASGVADVSQDTLVLHAELLPPSTSILFFQGTAIAGQVFGDGILCAGGAIIRLAGVAASPAGSAHWPTFFTARVSERGQVPASGGTRYYQGWYRNAAPFCTSAPFNLTNGLAVDWVP
jgi:hypothetical protein